MTEQRLITSVFAKAIKVRKDMDFVVKHDDLAQKVYEYCMIKKYMNIE